jgi:YbbR domain-containing protein
MKNAGEAKKKKKYGIIPKLLCLLLAFGIWIYVTYVDSPEYEETFNLVPVQLEGVSELESSSGLYVYSGYDNTVNVTVTGRRSVINQITSDSITLYADVSSLNDEGRNTVSISADLPAGIVLSSLSADSINVYVGEKDEVVLSVKPVAREMIISSSLRVGDLTPEYDTVTVTGPREVIETLDYASADVYAGNSIISESITVTSQLTILDKDGNTITNPYVKLSRTEVNVDVPVYTTKTLKTAVNYKYGYFNSSNTNITIEPSTIEVEGDPKELDSMTEFVVGTIDEKSFKNNGSVSIKISDTDTVSVVDDVTTAVVTVEHKGTSLKTLSLTDIRLSGASDGKYELMDKELSVTLRGPGQTLANLTASNVYATVDVSGYSSSTTSIINVPATIRFKDGASNSVYEIGTYTVSVKIG